jgi:prevent-host-death family protein
MRLMGAVSVREFSYNPSAVFARVERGEAVEVTRHGKVIAVIVPGSGVLGRYAPLIAKGIIRLKPTTTRDLSQVPHYVTPEGTSPLDLLLAEREADSR